jgi:hypothetical protein
VYKAGVGPLTKDERELALLLAAGKEAVLSHLSAARRLGLQVPEDGRTHLLIPDSRGIRSFAEAKVWRTRDLDEAMYFGGGRG